MARKRMALARSRRFAFMGRSMGLCAEHGGKPRIFPLLPAFVALDNSDQVGFRHSSGSWNPLQTASWTPAFAGVTACSDHPIPCEIGRASCRERMCKYG